MRNELRVCGGKIHLIDNGNDFEVVIQCKIGIGQSLRLNSLCRIHDKNSPVTGCEGSAYLIVKVHMPRRVNQVKNILLSVLRLIDDSYGLGLNRNSPFPLDIHVIENLRLHFPLCQCSGLLDDAVRESGLSVINMRNNTKISNSLLIKFFHCISYKENDVFSTQNLSTELYHKNEYFSIQSPFP